MNLAKWLNGFLIWIASIIFFIATFNTSVGTEAATNYFVIIAAYSVCYFIFLFYIRKFSLRLFEPITIVTAIFFLMFVYYPLVDINREQEMFFVQSFASGTFKGTAVAALSFIAFMIGYYYDKKSHIEDSEQLLIENTEEEKDIIVVAAVIFWIIGFIGNVVYLLLIGKNLSYIFTLGAQGAVDSEQAFSGPVGFVGMFAFLSVASWQYINQYSRSTWLKIATYILTLIPFLVRGFRFIVVIIFIAPIILYYEKRKSKPKLWQIITMLVILLIMIAILGQMRNSIRSGVAMETGADLSSNAIDRSLYDNFGQYRAFYIMVSEIPSNVPFTYGVKTFINPLIMFIPRLFWPTKMFFGEASKYFLSQEAIVAGSAYPNIGEFYMDFGIIGTAIAMFFEGYILGRTKRWINGKRVSIHTYIAYAITVPLVLQIVIRGYMASNFNLIVFLLLPVAVCASLKRSKAKEKGK